MRTVEVATFRNSASMLVIGFSMYKASWAAVSGTENTAYLKKAIEYNCAFNYRRSTYRVIEGLVQVRALRSAQTVAQLSSLPGVRFAHVLKTEGVHAGRLTCSLNRSGLSPPQDQESEE